MRTVELTAKSVDEAKKAAAEKLGVALESVQVTVLEETKGLFGKTNVRVKAEAAEGKAAIEAPAAPAAKPARGRGAKAPAEAKVVEEEPVEVKAEEKKPAAKGRGKKAASEPLEQIQKAMDAPPPAEVAEADGEEAVADVIASEEDAANFQKLVDGLLDAGNLEVTAKAATTGGKYVNIALDGKDVAHLVGKHGEVLNAFQYLVNIMASRKYGNGVRATLDGNDFRRRREEALTSLATKIAEQVKARREEAVLDALPAFERRVVHKALTGIPGVTTYSEGEEPNRRVVIAPEE